jgi:hypothetical protein
VSDRLTPLENARQPDPWFAADAVNSRRLWKMIMLSPTVEILDALLAGEAVPIEQIDPVWVRRFGVKP